jgi:hypothetical protein
VGRKTEGDRYPKDWATRSRNAKLSQKFGESVKCSCCRKLYAWDDVDVHHAAYKGEGDRAGVNIFPVCGSTQEPGTCHHWLHLKENWIRDRKNYWNNRNTDKVLQMLRHGYNSEPVFGERSISPQWIGWGIAIALLGWILSPMIFRSPVRTATIDPPRKYQAANVRSGPSEKYPKAGTPLMRGTKVEVIEEQKDWVKIGRDVKGDRWVAKSMIKK